MAPKASSLAHDPLVALVGGGGLVLAALPALWVANGFFPFGTSWVPFVFFIALVVLAFGLPGRPGVVGSGRFVRIALVVGGGVPLLASIATWFVPVDEASLATPAHAVIVGVLTALQGVSVLAIVAAAVVAALSTRVDRAAKLGLAVLAVVTVVGAALPYLFSVLVARGPVSNGTNAFGVLELFCGLVQAAVGIWFARPWLAPRAAAGLALFRRVRQRHVDSTP